MAHSHFSTSYTSHGYAISLFPGFLKPGIRFASVVWFLWKHRNKVCFENTPLNLVLHKTCFSQVLEYFYEVAKIRSQNSRVAIPIRWLKPPMNWLKHNTDGASFGNPGKTGWGGVIRDSAGRWVKGFSRSIGLAINVMVECWALKDGLQLANHLGIQNILVVKLDAKIIVDILQSNQ